MFKERPSFETIRMYGARFPEFDFSAIESFISMARLSDEVSQALDAHFSRHDLSRGRFFLLVLLLRSGDAGVSPANLAEGCGVTRATVTGLLDTLEASGLIAREAAPEDRRALVVKLTAAGKAKLDAVLPDHFKRISRLMQGLTEDERRTFVSLLAKISLGIDALKNP
jgi:DNA-binding MarR family transcriptional regulator